MSDDLFEALTPDEDTVVDPTKNYLDELVGEDKPYKDTTALARAAAEKEAFIERLKRENAALRQENAAKGNLSDLVTKLAEVKTASPNIEVEETQERDVPQINIKEAVQSELTRIQTEARQAQNKATVLTKLKEVFGQNYLVHLTQEANRLGMSTEQMNNLAATSPAAFLRLVGAEKEVVKQNDILPQSQVNSSGFKPNVSPGKTKSYYSNLLKTDKKKFLSPAVQNEMHEQAKRLGPAFHDV